MIKSSTDIPFLIWRRGALGKEGVEYLCVMLILETKMKIFSNFFKLTYSSHGNEAVDNVGIQEDSRYFNGIENEKKVAAVQSFFFYLGLQGKFFRSELEDKDFFEKKITYNVRLNVQCVIAILVCMLEKGLCDLLVEIRWHIRVVKVLITITTAKKVEGCFYEVFANGTVKKVLIRNDDEDHVYYTPQRKGLFGKLMEIFHEKELREEVNLVREIDKKFKKKGIDGAYVVHDFEEVVEKAHGSYTIRSTKATYGDLGKFIKKRKITFPASLRIVSQIIQAVSDLHAINVVQGDIKPENILVFGTEENPIVKLSDFGKARKLKKKEETRYLGTPYFAPWECRLSQKGEISSVGLVAIVVLENQFLSKDIPVLVPVEKRDQKASNNDVNKRRGIVKFVAQNKYFPQTVPAGMVSFIRVLLQRLCPQWEKVIFKTDPRTADEQLGKYVDMLTAKIKSVNVGEEAQVEQLGVLLKAMTQSDVSKRPHIKEVKSILDDIVPRVIF